MTINLKGLSIEQLQNLVRDAKAEIESRSTATSATVVWRHDCANSAKNHLNKYKHWAKLIKSVDLNKTDGYAFVGQFLRVTNEEVVRQGAIVVECCGTDITAYRCDGDYVKTEIAAGRRGSLHSLIVAVGEAAAEAE